MESATNCSSQKIHQHEPRRGAGGTGTLTLSLATLLILLAVLCLIDLARLHVAENSGKSAVYAKVPDSCTEIDSLEFPAAALLCFQPLDINSASLEELVLLPGIGVKSAAELLNFRMRRGFLLTTDEIDALDGLSASRYQSVKTLLTTIPWNEVK